MYKYDNLLKRQFKADRPNTKWVTDISYIHTKEGVLYLSMIRDLYDNSIVAYKTSSRQTVSLVLDTIRLAMKNEKKRAAAELQLHSDQGFQYTSQGYFNLTQSYGITPSMSSKGNPYDNAMAEKFFSILKTECIYRHKPKTFREANDLIDRYILLYCPHKLGPSTFSSRLLLREDSCKRRKGCIPLCGAKRRKVAQALESPGCSLRRTYRAFSLYRSAPLHLLNKSEFIGLFTSILSHDHIECKNIHSRVSCRGCSLSYECRNFYWGLLF